MTKEARICKYKTVFQLVELGNLESYMQNYEIRIPSNIIYESKLKID